MPTFTNRLNMYLPGDDSNGAPDEQVDVEKLNQNFRLLDDAIGIPHVTRTTRPSVPFDTMMVFETDTRNLMTYSLAAVRWLPVGTPNAASDSIRLELFPNPAKGDRVVRTDLGYVQAYRVSSDGLVPTNGWYREDEGQYVIVQPSASQTFSGTVAKVNWQTEIKKTDIRLHDTTNHTRFKAPQAGTYRLKCHVWINASSGNNLLAVYKNGTLDTSYRDGMTGVAGMGAWLKMCEEFILAANDYLEIGVASGGSDPNERTRTQAYFEIVR